jgi:hypothetical protein
VAEEARLAAADEATKNALAKAKVDAMERAKAKARAADEARAKSKADIREAKRQKRVAEEGRRAVAPVAGASETSAETEVEVVDGSRGQSQEECTVLEERAKAATESGAQVVTEAAAAEATSGTAPPVDAAAQEAQVEVSLDERNGQALTVIQQIDSIGGSEVSYAVETPNLTPRAVSGSESPSHRRGVTMNGSKMLLVAKAFGDTGIGIMFVVSDLASGEEHTLALSDHDVRVLVPHLPETATVNECAGKIIPLLLFGRAGLEINMRAAMDPSRRRRLAEEAYDRRLGIEPTEAQRASDERAEAEARAWLLERGAEALRVGGVNNVDAQSEAGGGRASGETLEAYQARLRRRGEQALYHQELDALKRRDARISEGAFVDHAVVVTKSAEEIMGLAIQRWQHLFGDENAEVTRQDYSQWARSTAEVDGEADPEDHSVKLKNFMVHDPTLPHIHGGAWWPAELLEIQGW